MRGNGIVTANQKGRTKLLVVECSHHSSFFPLDTRNTQPY